MLLVAAPRAAAAVRHLSAAQAVRLAEADRKLALLLVQNPGAHWDTNYDRGKRSWVLLLEPKGALNVLAQVTVSERKRAVTKVKITNGLGPPNLDANAAFVVASRSPRVKAWIGQYSHVTHSSDLGPLRVWTVKYYDRDDQIAEVHVQDATGRAYEVWTGPQVGWMLARGLPDAYGRKVNRAFVLWPMCAIFLAGLVDWRRLRSMRTLDLVASLGFVVSLIEFNHGDIFRATPLIYPPLVYLAARMVWVGTHRRPREVRVGETHLLILIALVCGLMGFRLGLNNQDSNVIDVGYAGVAGASRLIDGVLPYGHMPDKTSKPCGGKYSNGDPRAYVQSNGQCESPIGQGDTYGPTIYLTYIPAVAILGWSGLWDSLPAAHVTASAYDLLAIAGLLVAGWRLANGRVGLLMAFGWAANPFTLYALNMNTNDALVGALLAWTLAALSVPALRGALLAAASFTKFAPLALVPLFGSLRHRFATLAGFAAAALVLLSMLVLDSNGLSLFWHRTLDYQLGRVTPMAIWTLPSYHPGWPDITWLQHALQFLVAVGIVLLLVFPRAPKDAAAIAALGAAAVIALQVTASYWFYPYVCWWLPLVLAALLLPRAAAEREATPEPAA
ncbi:MAG TPA: hypothetical protein VH459_10920 [Gaiellales bacterium]